MSDTESIQKEVLALRRGVGLWLRDTHTFVRFTGADVATWLQSQATNDVVALESGEGHANALCDRQGRLQAHFTLHRWEDEYWAVVERAQTARLIEQLDAHLFIEDVQMEDSGGEVDQVLVQGPQSLALLAQALGADHAVANAFLPRGWEHVHPVELLGHEVLAIRHSESGEDGYLLIAERGEGEALLEKLAALTFDPPPMRVSPEAREVLRIEAGIPQMGVDISERDLLPETTLERNSLSYSKGCFLGQEVIARLKTYGAPKRYLMGLTLEAEVVSGDLLIDGKKVGALTSSCFSPTLGECIAMASLDRDHRTPGQQLGFTLKHADGETPLAARVGVLPLYEAPSRGERARTLYERALDLFQEDPDDTDPTAIPLLQEAVLLDPDFEDAYEVLGVILHRHGRLPEAVRIMEQLAERNPDCLMAHTNLSVFYVAQGDIERAEEEKAKAAVLQIQSASDNRAAHEAAQAERKKIESEARQRIEMFLEVLDIDPDDPVATFGLGKAYVQLGQHADAIPHLRRATEVQKDFSAAFLELGKCHQAIGENEAAAEAFHAGIAVAARKGDLMPLREMERRLKEIDAVDAAT